MKQETVVWTAPAIWPVFHMQAEIILKELKEESNVTVVYCAGYQKSCEANPHMSKIMCQLCIHRFDYMIQYFADDNVSFVKLELPDSETIKINNDIEKLEYGNLDSLKKLTLEDGNDIGSAVYSTLLSRYRDPLLDIEQHKEDTASKLYDAYYNYKFSEMIMDKKGYSKSIIFNCRINNYRPILRLFVRNSIPTYCWDVLGSDCSNVYNMNYGAYPHEPIAFSKKIVDIYNNSRASIAEREKTSKNWFDNRINFNDTDTKVICRSMTNDSSFRNRYPEHNFVCSIFLSSEHELMTLVDFMIKDYKNQYDAVSKIVQYLKSDSMAIIIRLHPNSLGTGEDYYRQFDCLKNINNNVEIISSDNDLSSYDIIHASDLVITFGSSIGIEACYLKKPSLLVAKNTYYSNLGGTVKVSSDDELKGILSSIVSDHDKVRSIFPNDEEKYKAAIIYGYGIQHYGTRLKYVTKDKNYYTLEYKGKILKSGKWILRFFYKVESIFNKLKKLKKYKKGMM